MRIAVLAALLVALPVSVSHARPQKTGAASSLTVTYRTLKRSKPKLYEASVKYPVFAGSSPVVTLANRAVRAYAEKEVAQFVKDSEADLKDRAANNVPGSNYELEISPVISLARPDLISITFNYYTFMGGAHPNHDYPAMNFGMVGGKAKLLELRDLFVPGFNPYGGLDKYIVPQLRKQEASSITEGEIKTLDKNLLRSWNVTPRSLTFSFAPYAVASYAEGDFEAKCTFTALKSVLNLQGPLRPVLR